MASRISRYREVDGVLVCLFVFFFQAEDGIRDLVRSRGLGDVYKRQPLPTLQHGKSDYRYADPKNDLTKVIGMARSRP